MGKAENSPAGGTDANAREERNRRPQEQMKEQDSISGLEAGPQAWAGMNLLATSLQAVPYAPDFLAQCASLLVRLITNKVSLPLFLHLSVP